MARKYNPINQIKGNIKRKNTMKTVGAIYELMWGEKPRTRRKKKERE